MRLSGSRNGGQLKRDGWRLFQKRVFPFVPNRYPEKIKVMVHYLNNKVGVVDFANAQGPEGPAGFEILPQYSPTNTSFM